MSEEKTYTIGQLAQAAKVTTRTIRYYVAEELLPAPEGAGRAATYRDEHLARLELIKILKEEYLPLQEIRTLLSGLNYQAVLELLEEKQKSDSLPPPAPNSAKEYLQTLLRPPAEPTRAPSLMRHKVKAQKQRSQAGIIGEETGEAKYEAEDRALPSGVTPEPKTKRASPTSPPKAVMGTLGEIEAETMGLAAEVGSVPIDQTASSSAVPLQPGEPQPLTRWQRIQLSPEVELHLKEGVENTGLWPKIEQLVKIAQQLLSSII